MCGIAGYLDPSPGCSPVALAASVSSMVRAIERRGPDDEGSWSDDAAGIALGHRRLAIVDLSPTGAQPMISSSGRYVLVTNGEIYDHRARRRELEAAGVRFRGTSDTEVLLEAVERWGLDETLRRCNGMFALALWDRRERRLSLARDRVGEKPLYIGRFGPTLAFASRPSAFAGLPGFDRDLDPAAVGAYLRLGFVPHPMSIFRQVRQLAPGEILEARSADGALHVTTRRWFRLEEVAVPEGRRTSGSSDALDDLDALLQDSVRLRLQADVPTGAFLSGGIDSSLVAALGMEVGSEPLRTFTVSVGSRALDESVRAAAIARHLGTHHTTIELSDAEAASALTAVPEAYDEPFADPSAMPTLLLCREVRRHVTVALGGDGGDELFAGYNRQVVGAPAWERAGRIPGPIRRAGGRALMHTPLGAVDALGRVAARVRRREATPHLGDKVVKVGRLMAADREQGPWAALASVWGDELPWTRGLAPALPAAPGGFTSALDQLRWLDMAVTLPDDMLVKVDRASMHWALEARVPFLDPRVVAWAWSRPADELIQGGQGKAPLRRLLARRVPESLTSGPKRGFDPPLAEWLRGPLRSWAEERLAPDALRDTGWIDPEPVRRAWQQHLGGRANHDYRLWTVLSFMMFQEKWASV